ncbi:MAG: alpha/beta hydrolase, partial [Pseudomonadota bacterium]
TPPEQETETIVLYAHGGGFVVGGLHSHDDICAELSAHAGAALVAMDYRMAPEHPFPAAVDDCWAVAESFLKQGSQLVVAGDSAGAKLSAAVALKARDEKMPGILGQVLIYGGFGGEPEGGSYEEHAHAPGLTTEDVKYYGEIYMGARPNPHWGDKLARPLLETDFSGLPPAFLVAAGLDPLYDDTFAYAESLKAAGVTAEARGEPDLVHGFIRARHMSDPAGASFAAIADAVKRFCHGGR